MSSALYQPVYEDVCGNVLISNLKIKKGSISINNNNILKKLQGNNFISSVSSSYFHTAILLNTGKVVTFGKNNYGQLGNSTFTDSDSLVNVTPGSGYDETNAIGVSCGGNHTAILLYTGRVLIFGLNNQGQLGNGKTENSNFPVDVSQNTTDYDGTNAIGVSCGGSTTQILLNTGKVIAFGANFWGQMGIGESEASPSYKTTPFDVSYNTTDYNGSNAIAVCSGGAHSAILLNTGKVVTFGLNNQGQLGNGKSWIGQERYGNYLISNTQVNVIATGNYNGSNAISVSCGSRHTSILLNTGQVVTFGLNEDGQLGNGKSGTQSYPNPYFSSQPVDVSQNSSLYNGSNAVSISCGAYHTSILLKTGSVVNFGKNINGQLGNGESGSNKLSNLPIDVSYNSSSGYNGTNAVAISCGGDRSSILLTSGKVDKYGQYWDTNNPNEIKIPEIISGINSAAILGYIETAVSNLYSLSTDISGVLFFSKITNAESINFNSHTIDLFYRQYVSFFNLFNFNNENNNIFNVKYKNNEFFTIDSAGSVGIGLESPTGKVHVKNKETNREITNISTERKRIYPISINLSNPQSVIRKNSGLVVLPTGKVISFGLNSKGQLGNNTRTSTTNPVDVSTTDDYNGSNAVSVSTGVGSEFDGFSAILLKTGKVLTFGYDVHGQLGYNVTTSGDNQLVPKPVEINSNTSYNGANAVAISCGNNFLTILLSNGEVNAVGQFDNGQLGDPSLLSNNISYSNGPNFYLYQQVTSSPWYHFNLRKVKAAGGYDGTNAIAISCGAYFTAILLSNGNVVSYGSNQYGQLGNNYTTGAKSDASTNYQYTYANQPEPIISYNGGNAIKISCGTQHIAILLSTGEVKTCGINDFGQLGIGTSSSFEKTFQNVKTDSAGYDGTNAIDIACGGSNTGILLSNGSVVTFGKGQLGELGNNTNVNKNQQVPVTHSNGYDGSNAVAIYYGHGSGLTVILDTGKVLSCGPGNFGQLGNHEYLRDNGYLYERSDGTYQYLGSTHVPVLIPLKNPETNIGAIFGPDPNDSSKTIIKNWDGGTETVTEGQISNSNTISNSTLYLERNCFNLNVADIKISDIYPNSPNRNFGIGAINIISSSESEGFTRGPTNLMLGNVDASNSIINGLMINQSGSVGIGTNGDINVGGITYQASTDLWANNLRANSNLLTYDGICYCPTFSSTGSSPMRVYSHGGNTIIGASYYDKNSETTYHWDVELKNNVGIGTNNPNFPLTVYGAGDWSNVSPSSPSLPAYGWNTNNTDLLRNIWTQSSTGNDQITAYFQKYTTAQGYVVPSDKRIKKNIRDVPDNDSLKKLRDISCSYYEYKDVVSRGFDTTIGFIAQNVREHMHMAVIIQKGIIPNELRSIENPQWSTVTDNSGNVTFKLTISDLEDVSGNTKYRFFVSNDPSGNNEVSKDVTTLEDEPKSFIFDEKWSEVFLYGKEVDDFHTLDKQKLFTLNFSATQEIDRIQQAQVVEIDILKEENQSLKNEITQLKSQMSDLLTRITALEN